jgi:hypothetical protein
MKIEIEIEKTEAYKIGYKHGLEEGIDMNPFNENLERFCYTEGYKSGVHDYCTKED